MTQKKKNKRATKLEKQQRIEMLTNLYALEYGYTYLVESASQKWDISIRQAKNYMSEVIQTVHQMGKQTAEKAQGTYISRYRVLYAKAVKNENWELATQIVTAEVKAYEAFKKDGKRGKSTHEADSLFNSEAFSEDELVKIMAAFEDDGAA
jgi:hypothetical protein